MAIDNYLIIGVNPANNETNVSPTSDVVITFSKAMDQASLTSANVILKEINGQPIMFRTSYNGMNKTLTLSSGSIELGTNQSGSTLDLNPGTTYQLMIVGGVNGVKTITGDYMSISRTYEFTTAATQALNAPTNVSVSVNSGFPSVQWTVPSDYDASLGVMYEVQISTSNLATNPPIWPSTGDINKTSSSVFNISKKLTEGNYYAYVRALKGDQVTDWTSVEFYVEAEATPVVTQPTDPTGTPSYLLDVVETYPKNDAVDVTPDKVIILFSENVDATSVNANSIYIIPKVKKSALTILDYMTEFSPSKAIQAPIDAITGPTNIITLTPSTGAIADDMEYTVIVRESVKNTSGSALGEAYTFSFSSNYSRLYGDVEAIRNDLGSMADSISDKVIYKFMSDNSEQAYQLVSNTDNFLASDYADGKAPYYIHQYVRYRTSYDLLLNSQLHSKTGTDFTKEVKLGDLTIQKEQAGGSASISGILSGLQEKIKIYLDELHGHHNRGYAKPAVAVRGENIEAYPDFLTRAEFSDLGS